MATTAAPSLPSQKSHNSLCEKKRSTMNVTDLQPIPWQPQPFLPNCWAPSKLTQVDKPAPLLYFGYPINVSQVRKFAIAHNFYPYDLEEGPKGSAHLATVAIMGGVVNRLQRACRAYLYRDIPFVPNDPNVYIMAALYSNYTYEEERYEDDDEKDIIEILQKELDITYPPMWFWAETQQNPHPWPRRPRRM